MSFINAAPADDIVSASDGSSQDAEEEVKSSQDSENCELNREEEDVKVGAAETPEQGNVEKIELVEGCDGEDNVMSARNEEDDVEMEEMEEEAKESVVVVESEEKLSSEVVDKTLIAEEKEERDGEETADGELTAECLVANGTAMEDVLEMEAIVETVQEATSESYDAASPEGAGVRTEAGSDVAAKPTTAEVAVVAAAFEGAVPRTEVSSDMAAEPTIAEGVNPRTEASSDVTAEPSTAEAAAVADLEGVFPRTEVSSNVAAEPTTAEVAAAAAFEGPKALVTVIGSDTACSENAESRELDNADVQDSSTVTKTEREDQLHAVTSDPINGDDEVTELVEPAAKKQKVNETVGTDSDIATLDASTAAVNGCNDTSPTATISRDDMAKMEEDSGRLKFDVITNDGMDEHMIQLTTLKNIFAKQLPKMPKEYIVRLVFDRNHRSMLILKNGTHVIGGICYRPFEKNGFAEIAFCAINASDQVKGYGTRLMNHLKEYVKTKNITHFLTYADNYAIGYFKKQGFTKSVSMARPNWYGYIKDYDGGTLMECTIHTQINYLRITSMIHRQRKAIRGKLEERSCSKRVYPGLTQFAEGRLMDIYMVPGVKEAGWSQAVIRNNRIGTRDQGSLKSQLLQLLKAVFNHRSAWPFHEPVDTTVVVDYLDHIKEPVDLQLISKRIDSGSYISKAAFKADLDRMCENCLTYNTPDTNYYK
uniref:histone acetyltransferase n=1 Tax=Hyaloperonospora arabidopsidis (strain Emoy2) TaxID=559515 RepID=M4B2H9_HYAAE